MCGFNGSFVVSLKVDNSRCLETTASSWGIIVTSHRLQWHHNERHGVSNHRRFEGLLNRLFRYRSKETSKFRVIGLCEGNPSLTGGFPHKGRVTENMFQFYDVIVTIDLLCDQTNRGLLQWHNLCDPILFIFHVRCNHSPTYTSNALFNFDIYIDTSCVQNVFKCVTWFIMCCWYRVGAVITRSVITWYYTHHCTDWDRIYTYI